MTDPRKPRVRKAKGTDPRLPQAVLLYTVSMYADHSIARVTAAPSLHDLRTDRLLGAVRLDTGHRHLIGLSAPAAARVVALSVARALWDVAERFGPQAGGPGAPEGAKGGALELPPGVEQPTLFDTPGGSCAPLL